MDRQLCQKLWQKKIELSQQQIKQAADIYHTWQKAGTDGKNFQKAEVYRSVGFKEVEEKNFVLTPSKYIKFIDKDLQIDFQKEMKRIQKATKDLLEEERQAQKMLEKAFCEAGYAID